jgi:flagellar assembly factor FliW
MQFNTTRFGVVEYEDEQVVTFPEGLPGFDDARRFVFLPLPGGSCSLNWMQCIDDREYGPALAFPVVSPWKIAPNYAPTIPGPAIRSLGISDVRSQVQLWSIVTVPRDRPYDATVNLLAPIVVNRETHIARQVVLLADEAALRTPLRPADRSGAEVEPPARALPTVSRPLRRSAAVGSR